MDVINWRNSTVPWINEYHFTEMMWETFEFARYSPLDFPYILKNQEQSFSTNCSYVSEVFQRRVYMPEGLTLVHRRSCPATGTTQHLACWPVFAHVSIKLSGLVTAVAAEKISSVGVLESAKMKTYGWHSSSQWLRGHRWRSTEQCCTNRWDRRWQVQWKEGWTAGWTEGCLGECSEEQLVETSVASHHRLLGNQGEGCQLGWLGQLQPRRE